MKKDLLGKPMLWALLFLAAYSALALCVHVGWINVSPGVRAALSPFDLYIYVVVKVTGGA